MKYLPWFGRDDEGESLAYAWASAEDGPMWRHGRAHLHLRGKGRRGHPDGTGPHGDVRLGTEWRLFPRQGFGLGASFKWGTNASETTPDLSVHLGRLGDLWLHAGGIIPYRWLERHTPDGKVDYDSRVFSVAVDGRGARFECWARDGHWSRSQPWWYGQHVEWRPFLLGRTATTETVEYEDTCVIPMPEHTYPGTVKVTRYEHHHQRPLGRIRDRVFGPRVHHRTEVTPGAPIPVPGKGENSWDCDDDHLWSTSIGGRNVEHAIASLVESALTERRRHGGMHMSVPS